MARNQIAPEKNFHKPRHGWKGNRNSDRTNPKNDPFFTSKKERPQRENSGNESTGSFFVSKKQKSEILEQRNNTEDKNKFYNRSNKFNRSDNTQGFFKNKSAGFDDKFKGGKVDKKTDKKLFDKKKWRLQTYSKKYKLEQWEDKRKKAVLREYYKEIKDDQSKLNVQKIYEQYDSDNETENNTELTDKIPNTVNRKKNYVQNPNFVPINKNSDDENQDKIETEETDKNQTSKKLFKGKPKNIAYKKAKSEFQRIKEEKEARKEEILKKKAEKEEALLEYKKKKTEKFKKLNKKTKHGQPIMKDRIEMLLEKIQSNS